MSAHLDPSFIESSAHINIKGNLDSLLTCLIDLVLCNQLQI
jgi:hypothetical protein